MTFAKKHDYTALDAAIVARIGSGCLHFNTILDGDVRKEAGKFLGESTFRFVDRRLQALRKAGKITWSRSSGWSVPK